MSRTNYTLCKLHTANNLRRRLSCLLPAQHTLSPIAEGAGPLLLRPWIPQTDQAQFLFPFEEGTESGALECHSPHSRHPIGMTPNLCIGDFAVCSMQCYQPQVSPLVPRLSPASPDGTADESVLGHLSHHLGKMRQSGQDPWSLLIVQMPAAPRLLTLLKRSVLASSSKHSFSPRSLSRLMSSLTWIHS